MPPAAYSFVKHFDRTPTQTFCIDRHYLVYAVRGALRLEDAGTVWSLPPARAALVEAGRSIQVSVPHPATTSSVLVDVDFAPSPPAPLAVFDVSPLVRELFSECARWDESVGLLDTYATSMFQALVAATWDLASRPSPAHMPSGSSAEVRRALDLTADRLRESPRFEEIAAEIGLAPRSLARRFEQELGMTWRAALRRMRVLRAIELLASSDDSVTQIALSTGYRSLSAFQSAFRDLTGTTASAYRSGFTPDG